MENSKSFKMVPPKETSLTETPEILMQKANELEQEINKLEGQVNKLGDKANELQSGINELGQEVKETKIRVIDLRDYLVKNFRNRREFEEEMEAEREK